MSTRKRNKQNDQKDGQKAEKDTNTHTEHRVCEKHANQTSPDKPVISYKRLAIRGMLITGTLFAARFFMTPPSDIETYARADEVVGRKSVPVPCSQDYKEDREQFKECAPVKCGRVVMDSIVGVDEAKYLLSIAKKGLRYGGSDGGASILDLHSGALSRGDKFINIYSLKGEDGEDIFTDKDFHTYKMIKSKIHNAISDQFGIPHHKLYLTKPTFFSRMTTKPAKTIHDEYWHPHVDKETYGSFDYTSLLYLSDYGTDFTGGRFVFIDKDTNKTVEPKTGRLSFFTSGSENVHFVEPVKSGTRYAITVSFTCDRSKAIRNPSRRTAPPEH